MKRTLRSRPHGIALPHLQAWREFRVLSGKELAHMSGVSNSFIGYLEQGTKKASPRTIGKLAQGLRVTREELVRDLPPIQHHAA